MFDCLRRHYAVILAVSRDHLRRHACLSLLREQRCADASLPALFTCYKIQPRVRCDKSCVTEITIVRY
jgi:hypothetical protein